MNIVQSGVTFLCKLAVYKLSSNSELPIIFSIPSVVNMGNFLVSKSTIAINCITIVLFFSNQSKQPAAWTTTATTTTLLLSTTTENTAVQVQFPPGNQTTTGSSVLNSVLIELQNKVSLTANELGVLDKEKDPEYQLKQLLGILNSRDSNKTIALEQLFDCTCEHGVRFSNLSQVSMNKT